MSDFHTSVLLQEVVTSLRVQEGKKYIDATLGAGGHAGEILERGGIVLGIDVDQEAIEYVKEKFKIGERLTLVRGNFRDIGNIAHSKGFDKVSGIVFDLGVSSHQLDKDERGFSFQKKGPLDMRMDQALGVKARDLVNALSKKELYELFTKLGEERYAHAISGSIVRARGVKQIETTEELVGIIEKSVNKSFSHAHPATRIFQALRIAVNDELGSLEVALPQALSLLEKNGRLIVISFHSLEDRIVKHAFDDFRKKGLGSVITKKPIEPGEDEIKKNRRARSAKLRIFEK